MLAIWCLPNINAKTTVMSRGGNSLDIRSFNPDQWAETIDTNISYITQFSSWFKHENSIGKVKLFSRYDGYDINRKYILIQDLYIKQELNDVEIRLGFQEFNWSFLDSFKLSDTLNSRVMDSPFFNPEKLGEPVITWTVLAEQSQLSIIVMPFVQLSKLPSKGSRFNDQPKAIASSPPLLDPKWFDHSKKSEEQNAIQYAIRYNETLQNADISLYFIHHIDRIHPFNSIEENGIRPLFFRNMEIGTTWMMPQDDHIITFESVFKNFSESNQFILKNGNLAEAKGLDHIQLGLGIEHSEINDNGWQIKKNIEFKHIIAEDRLLAQELSIFQSDIFFNYQIDVNNTNGTLLQVSAVIDLERRHEYIIEMSYVERLSDTWKIMFGKRWLHSDEDETNPKGLNKFGNMNELFISTTRYF